MMKTYHFRIPSLVEGPLRLYSSFGSPKEVGLLIYGVQTDQGLKGTP